MREAALQYNTERPRESAKVKKIFLEPKLSSLIYLSNDLNK